MAGIDVRRCIADLERELRIGNPMRCGEVFAILERWQWDEMLDDASRAAARRLLHEFRSVRR
jgi:hypothetical protein